MREIISINIGQGGVQMSNAAWELFCMEHGVQANGMLKEHLRDGDSSAFKTFFQEIPNNIFVPRVISVDLDTTVIDEVRTGHYRSLFNPNQLISGTEDAANNFARGHFTLGKQLIEIVDETICNAVAQCDMLQGFLILSSLGGGTGSGFTSLVLERLTTEFTKSTKFQIIVVPSSHLTTAVTEPYNAILCTNASTNNSEICSMFDNESIYSICANSLNVPRPTYSNINRILAQVFSSITVSLRFESLLNSDMDQLVTNLIPYPRIHFPITCYSPIMSIGRAAHETLTTVQLTKRLFEKSNQMICCNMEEGRYMSCCLQYRGDVSPKDVNSAIYNIKKISNVKFVNWCPTGFKLGISSQPPTIVPGSEMSQTSRNVTMLTNSTAISQLWYRLGQKFDVLFSKRSFVHWYVGEGMEEGEFNEAKDEAVSIVCDYLEIADEDDEEEQPEQEPPIETKIVNVDRDELEEKEDGFEDDMVMGEQKETNEDEVHELTDQEEEAEEEAEAEEDEGFETENETNEVEEFDLLESF